MMEFDFSKLEFYMLVSNDKFFRTKGYNGSGESWISDIKKAKVWTKIGPARAAQTFFSDEKYLKAGFPIPTIIKLTPLGSEMIDDHERIQKAKNKKLKTEKLYIEGCLKRSIQRLNEFRDKKKNSTSINSLNFITNMENEIQRYKEKISAINVKISSK